MIRSKHKELRRERAHYGYHWRGEPHFFEGWYFRLTLPPWGQSFAFMYEVRVGQERGSVQVLGQDDQLINQELENYRQFTASYVDLQLHYTSVFAISDRHQRGRVGDSQHICSWDFAVDPIFSSWGETMGWLSYLPIFEPYWQILLPYGLAQGQITWNDQVYQFAEAPIYAEKNWGISFPQKWFWLQCHTFGANTEPINLVSAGGLRQVLGRTTAVAMVALWWQGQVYRFMPENSCLWCDVSPWGSWYVQADSGAYRIEIRAIATGLPSLVGVPTAQGQEFICRDTAQGTLEFSLWRGNCRLLQASSALAALETGGAYGGQNWRFSSERI